MSELPPRKRTNKCKVWASRWYDVMTNFKPANDTEKRLLKVGDRDKWTCALCGHHVHHPINEFDKIRTMAMTPSLDHIIPVSLGGTWRLDNLQLAHKLCNSTRGSACMEWVRKNIKFENPNEMHGK